ncbi:MAG TPA: nucleotidyltransferase family protein [Acidimicrobiia bacterium]|nr:nucleotidyltransferase family protein [Acidimicrobiia bacterium]
MSTGSLRELLDRHNGEVRETVRRHRGRKVSVFGSVARGDESPTSDIDLLVEFEPESSLFDLLHLQQDLEALLGHRVDVVSRGGLLERDRDILDEAIEL